MTVIDPTMCSATLCTQVCRLSRRSAPVPGPTILGVFDQDDDARAGTSDTGASLPCGPPLGEVDAGFCRMSVFR